MSEVDPLVLLQPAASRVRDPVTGRSVWLANMVRNARVEDGALKFDLFFAEGHSRDDRRGIEEAVVANLKGLGWEGEVLAMGRREGGKKKEVSAKVEQGSSDPVPGMTGGGMAPHGGPIVKQALPGVRHIIAVASGKGGVGKSTVSVNLAVGLAQAGFAVGLLDADVYGPSLPTMMGMWDRPMATRDGRIMPPEAHGVRCLSMGMLVDKEQAVIWRGPMVMGAVRQFLQQTQWGDLDYLVVDLPPGTGDTQLTLVQGVPISGAVIVTTPQEVALADAVRGISMFRKLDVPLLGLVENMAYYELPDGSRDFVFGEGGGLRTAAAMGTEVLGQVPLRTVIQRSGDSGTPIVLSQDPSAALFQDIVGKVAGKLKVAPRS